MGIIGSEILPDGFETYAQAKARRASKSHLLSAAFPNSSLEEHLASTAGFPDAVEIGPRIVVWRVEDNRALVEPE